MENQTPFELGDAIAKWRASLIQSFGLRAEELEELELHLRDSVSALQKRGLSEEEAWIIAQRRLGPRAELRNEFAKITPPAKALGSAWAGFVAAMQTPAPNTSQILHRIILMERNIVLPVKAVAIAILLFSFYSSPWFTNVSSALEIGVKNAQSVLWGYIGINITAAGLFLAGRHVRLSLLHLVVFAMTLVDGVLILTLTILVGYPDTLYWLFPLLFVRAAVSVPRLGSQILLWVTLSICFVMASLIESSIAHNLDDVTRILMPYSMPRESQPTLLRLVLLLSVAACCYGVQMLLRRSESNSPPVAE